MPNTKHYTHLCWPVLLQKVILPHNRGPHSRDVLSSRVISIFKSDVINNEAPRFSLISPRAFDVPASPRFAVGRIDSVTDSVQSQHAAFAKIHRSVVLLVPVAAAFALFRPPVNPTAFCLAWSWRLVSRSWARRISSLYFDFLTHALIFGNAEVLHEFPVNVPLLSVHFNF